MSGSTDMDARVARYLAGEMTPAEAAALEREAEVDAELKARLRDARTAWDAASGDTGPAVDVDAAWARLSARTTAASDVRVLRLPRRGRMPRPAPTPLRVAAAVALILAGAAVYRAVQTSDEALVTAAGEQRTWSLPDGSTVRLGPAARLRVRNGYGTRHREVELEGEAYFVAARGSAPPLTVAAGDARVVDVGTAFTVRALADAAAPVRVVVTQGAVWLGPVAGERDAGVTLRAGQVGSFDETAGARLVGAADTVAELAWTRGRLVFDAAALNDVARDLERWYDIDVQLADPQLGARRLTASFEGEPVEEVIDVIARTLGLSVDRTDRRVTFRAREDGP